MSQASAAALRGTGAAGDAGTVNQQQPPHSGLRAVAGVADLRHAPHIRPRAQDRPRRRPRNLVLDLALIVVKFLILTASAIVLLILGPDDDSPFREDLAAAAICLVSSLVLGVVALAIWLTRRDATVLKQLEQLALIFLDVNATCFAVLALLAHALPVLLQILTLAANICWVLSCLSVTAWIWRRGVEAPISGEVPIMLQLLVLPKPLLIAAFVLFEGLAVGTLFYKPKDKLNLSTELGRLEHLVLFNLGSSYIAAVLCILYLFFSRSGRRLLVFTGGHPRAEAPMNFNTFIQAVVISASAVLYGAVFLAIVIYAIVAVVVLWMAWISLRWSIVPEHKKKKEFLLKDGKDGRPTGSSSKVAPERSETERTGFSLDRTLEGISNELERAVNQVSDEILEEVIAQRTLRKSKKKMKSKEPATCKKRVKKCMVTTGLIMFAFAKVALIFVAFLFDVVFIQKAMTPLESRDFVLVKEDARCGQEVQLFEGVDDAKKCARRVRPEDDEGVLFVFGTKNGTKVCYEQDVLVDQSMYDDIIDDRFACQDEELVQHLDLYAVEPAQSCSVGRRLTAVGEEQVLETDVAESKYTTTDDIDEGMAGMFGRWMGDATEWTFKVMEWILDLKFSVPRDMSFKCRAPRRVLSASLVLAAVLALGAVAALDVLTVLAAAKDISAARAGELEGFVNYLIMIARPQLLEMLAVTILQIAITSSVPFLFDAFAVFTDSCGTLVRGEHMAGTNCPNIWHLPVDIAASAVLFLAIGIGVGFLIAVFAGLQYGLPPTQWAIHALFGRYLRLASFVVVAPVAEQDLGGAAGGLPSQPSLGLKRGTSKEMLPSSTDAKGGGNSGFSKFLRPFMGLPVTLGMWTTCSSIGFQIGRRQEWYEPIDDSADVDQEVDGSVNGDLVTWKSMYSATAKTISLAWLTLPRGILMSKAALYLNEYVIFTHGSDGGGSKREPEPISRHFHGDTPQAVSIMHWTSWAIQFAIVCAVNFDLLGDDEDSDSRLTALQVCIIIVVGIAVLRVILEIIHEVMIFARNKGVVGRCVELIQDREILGILHGESKSEKTDGLLKGVCHDHREKILLACQELATLEWVCRSPEADLPKPQRTLLRSKKIQNTRRYRLVLRMLDEYTRNETQKLDNSLRGEVVLLLHEAVDDEVQSVRCRKLARQHCIVLCNTESQAQGQHLQGWAENQAKAEAVAEGRERQRAYEEAVKRVERLRQHGVDMEMPPEPVTKFQLFFTAAATGVARVTGMWAVSGLELLPHPQEVRSTISVQGEIVLAWKKELRSDQFDQADLVVNSVSHRITIHGLTDEEKDELNGGMKPQPTRSKSVRKSKSFGTAGCEMCEHEAIQPSGCCSISRGIDQKDLEEGRQQWSLSTLGVEWHRDHEAAEHESSRFGSPGSTGAETPGSGSTKHTRHFDEAPVAWKHAVSPPPTFTKADQSISVLEALRKLEDAIAQGVGRGPEMLRAAFINALSADDSRLSTEDAARRTSLLAVASRMMRGSKNRPSFTAPVEHVEPIPEPPESRELSPEEKLRAALAREPLDADELSSALEVARQADVDPSLLRSAEEAFSKLFAKQQVVLKLVEAMESRMIGNLRSCLAEARDAGIIRGEFPDESSVGVIEKAEAVLEEEKVKAAEELGEASKANGALRLQRAIAQAEEAGVDEELLKIAKHRLQAIEERKRRIALLKMSLATNEPSLLRTAIEECEKEGLDDESDKVDVRRAKERLAELELAAEKAKAAQSQVAIRGKGGALQQLRAKAALRAAVYADPTQAVLLRLAIAQAHAAGLEGPELEHAEDLAQREAEKERMLEGLKNAAASNDIKDLGSAIRDCRDSGVDNNKMLSAIAQLIEKQRKVASSAGSHGIDSVVLADLERERRDLHNHIQEAHGAIKVICRVRPFLPSELEADGREADAIPQLPPLLLNRPQSTGPSTGSMRRTSNGNVLSVAGTSVLTHALSFSSPSAKAHAKRALSPGASQRQARAGTGAAARLGQGHQPHPAVVRVDRHTVCVLGQGGEEQTFRTGCVFGADSIQAELWNEVRSLVQSAVDGYNISLIACGPKRAGKTFTLLGGRSEGRGILPRLFDHLFALRERDSWRAELQVEAQLVEIYDSTQFFDLLSRGRDGARSGAAEATRLSGRPTSGRLSGRSMSGLGSFRGSDAQQAWGSPRGSPRGGPGNGSPRQSRPPENLATAVDMSVMTRQVDDNLELQRLVEENWNNPVQPDRTRQVLLVLHLTRTNRATSATTRSKIVCVDMAGLGEDVSREVHEAHDALHVVLEAITNRQRDVPFDGHILTQVLQDCMGGNSKTLLLLALSPAEADAQHVLATLALAPVSATGSYVPSRRSSKVLASRPSTSWSSRPPSRQPSRQNGSSSQPW